MDDWWQNDSYRGDFWKPKEPLNENPEEFFRTALRLCNEIMSSFTREQLIEWRACCEDDPLALAAIDAQLAYLKRRSSGEDDDAGPGPE